MNWFIFALGCFVCWGLADLFYKKGADEEDKYSHLKTAVWVGLIMGIFSIILLPFGESNLSFSAFIDNGIKYLPASLSYIISMVIGYAGLRYLELSIVSPVQNASGALSALVMVLYFTVTGNITNIFDEFSNLDLIATLLIVVGVIALAFVEKRGSDLEERERLQASDRKYKYGAAALLFPIMYCIFDTIGTAFDGIILDESTGLGLGEIDVLILYGFTFLLAGFVAWIYMYIKTKRVYNPLVKKEKDKAIAASFEQIGQIFYVYAMAKEPVLAAPMVASYCIFSVILSRIFIGEKLRRAQSICVFLVILGIVILGISEGLAEA